ncbi:MAG: valine--pyruvate transaminase [Akkermansiaceae bacterium]
MSHDLSEFGTRLCSGSGIESLMDDLGHALATGGDDMKMLGGGQPAHIPEVNAIWRKRMEEILASSEGFEKMLCNYDPPRGNTQFLDALAQLFKESFGWDITAKNLAITAGGQTAFFFLFNAIAGKFTDGSKKKILLPLVPEYIGYANQSVGEEMFHAVKPLIEKIGEHDFKYRVDFDNINITDDIAAICVSRPTNPTGNVLTDAEIARLSELAKAHDIPLIIDNAYGAPFPNIIFSEATPVWDESMVLTLSLSKLGLPGTRTGIVVACEEITAAVSSMSAIVGLANGNIGQVMLEPLVRSGEILSLSKEIIQPFYIKKSRQAREWVRQAFDESLPYRIHLSEGALFFWFWFEDLPITSAELYERLKARGVLIVSGDYFFFGLDDTPWKHREECIRVTFTMDEKTVREGIQVIAEEVAAAYQ